MRRIVLAVTVGLLAVMALAAPVSARSFGHVYVDDAVYRVFGNKAHVPDGTGTDPFAILAPLTAFALIFGRVTAPFFSCLAPITFAGNPVA
jgi:hypothetical protein